jgi:hypothetical protein
MVGLTNVDNTTDLSKPISTLTQIQLDLKAPINNPTFTGTISGIDKTMMIIRVLIIAFHDLSVISFVPRNDIIPFPFLYLRFSIIYKYFIRAALRGKFL